MTKHHTSGESIATRVVYKPHRHGAEYVIFANPNEVERYRKNPDLVRVDDVVQSYAIYENPKGASEGLLDKPSHKKLYEDFQMDDEMEIMKFILLKGDVKGVGTGSVAGSTRKDTGTSKDRSGPIGRVESRNNQIHQ